jgi:hypothetical protein
MTELDIRAWFAARVPKGWFTGPPDVQLDADEVLVSGQLPGETAEAAGSPRDGKSVTGAAIQRFREASREERVRIAQEAERRFGRKVSWGVRVGDETLLFSNLSLPVMTRLRLNERQVLDTLVGAGVARSRSDALAWCVRLVAKHEADWIAELKEALVRVGELRRKGPA